MHKPSSQGLCEALLATVIGLLIANVIILITSLPSWVVFLTKDSFWIFTLGLIISSTLLVVMYRGIYFKARRSRLVGALSCLLLAIATLPFGLTAKDETKLLMDRCDEYGDYCVILSVLISYGSLALSFGVAAISANLLANLFPKAQ